MANEVAYGRAISSAFVRKSSKKSPLGVVVCSRENGRARVAVGHHVDQIVRREREKWQSVPLAPVAAAGHIYRQLEDWNRRLKRLVIHLNPDKHMLSEALPKI